MHRESRTGAVRPVLATRKSGRERKQIIYNVDDDVSEKENQPRSPRIKKIKPKTRKQSEKRKRGEDVVDGLTSDEDDSADEERRNFTKTYQWNKPVRKVEKPKKPSSAAGLWGKDNAKRLKEENPDMEHFALVVMRTSEYKKQPDSVKNEYTKKHDELMAKWDEAMENYESPGDSDVEYFTVDDSAAVKVSATGRTKRTDQRRKRVRYNPENELTHKQRSHLHFDQLNDYDVQRDDWLSARRSDIYKAKWGKRTAKKLGFKDGKLPTNYKTPRQIREAQEKKERDKPKRYINKGFKNDPSKAMKDNFAWRWTHNKEQDLELDIYNIKLPQMEKWDFYCRPKDRSFWETDWYDGATMKDREVGWMAVGKLRSDGVKKPDSWAYYNSYFPIEELRFDVSSEKEKILYERFYKYGIQKAWLTIDRIVFYDAEKDLYLVKWCDLGLVYATFESVEDCEADGMEKAVEDFHILYDSVPLRNEHKPYKAPKMSKKRMVEAEKELSKENRLTTQPDWIPQDLKLYDYQLKSLNWLNHSWAQKRNVILADEMGLGKTIQTIVFIRSIIETTGDRGPFMVIVPMSTCENWKREFAKWAPDLYCVLYYGEQDERDMIKKYEFNLHEEGYNQKATMKFDVLLTSYEVTVREMPCLKQFEWRMIVIDEAHRLKSGNSKLNDILKNYNTWFKLLLTGTPIQNTMEELFHLLEYLDDEEFNSLESFLQNFSNVGEKEKVLTLHKLLSTRMLRRTKKDVFKDMVGKTEQIVQCSLMPQQISIYKAILTKNYKKLNCKNGITNSSGRNVLMDLRKICNHPYMFSKLDLEAKLDEGQVKYHVPAAMEASGKLTVLVQMCKKLKQNGNRVLIFTQFIKVLEILEDVMAHYNWEYRRLDGNVALRNRQQGIDDFNREGSEVFSYLISTKAGGLGINLATADTVIFYDHDFNPHNDLQALARSHRLGQKKHVMIYKLVTADSVEERMLDNQKRKMMLSHVIVEGGKETTGENFLDNLDDLLKFGAEKIFTDGADSAQKRIEYDDEAIVDLLDREKHVKLEAEAKKLEAANSNEENDILNNYMGEFKVATYKVRPKTKDELEYEARLMNDDGEADGMDYEFENRMDIFKSMKSKHEKGKNTAYDGTVGASNVKVGFWSDLLSANIEEEKQKAWKIELNKLEASGRGKRIRKQVNYGGLERFEYERQLELQTQEITGKLNVSLDLDGLCLDERDAKEKAYIDVDDSDYENSVSESQIDWSEQNEVSNRKLKKSVKPQSYPIGQQLMKNLKHSNADLFEEFVEKFTDKDGKCGKAGCPAAGGLVAYAVHYHCMVKDCTHKQPFYENAYKHHNFHALDGLKLDSFKLEYDQRMGDKSEHKVRCTIPNCDFSLNMDSPRFQWTIRDHCRTHLKLKFFDHVVHEPSSSSKMSVSEVQAVNPPEFLFKCKKCAKENENYKGERDFDEAEQHDMRHRSEERLEKYNFKGSFNDGRCNDGKGVCKLYNTKRHAHCTVKNCNVVVVQNMATFDDNSPIIRHHLLHQENKKYEKNLNMKFYLATDIDSRTGQFKCLSDQCTFDGYHAHCLDCENIVYKSNQQHKNPKLVSFPAPHANPTSQHAKLLKHKELHEELPKYGYQIEKFTSMGHELASCKKCGKGKVSNNEVFAKRNGYEFLSNAFISNVGRTIRIAKLHVKDCGVDFEPVENNFRLSITKDVSTGKDVYVCTVCEKLACSNSTSEMRDVLNPNDYRFIKKQNALLHSNKHKREKDLQKQLKAREFKNQFACSFRAPTTIDLCNSEPKKSTDQELLECYCLKCGEVVLEADAPNHKAKHSELSKVGNKWWDKNYYKLPESKENSREVIMKYKCRTCKIMVKLVDLKTHADSHSEETAKSSYLEQLKSRVEPLNFMVLEGLTDENEKYTEQLHCMKCGKIETSKHDAKVHHGKHEFVAALDNFLVKIRKNPDYLYQVPVIPDREDRENRESYYGEPKPPKVGPEPLEVYECSDKNCLKNIEFDKVQAHVFEHAGAEPCFEKKCLEVHETEFHIHCTRCLDTVDVLANGRHQHKHDRDEQVNKINDAGDEVTQQENELIPKGYDCKIIGCIQKGVAHLHCKRPNCENPLEIGKGFEHCFDHNNSNNPNSAKNKNLEKYKIAYFGRRDDCPSRRCKLINTEHLHCMKCSDVFEIQDKDWSAGLNLPLHNHGHENLVNDRNRGFEIFKNVDGVAASEADFEEGKLSKITQHGVGWMFSYRCLEDGCDFYSNIKQSTDLIENENVLISNGNSERVDLTISENKIEAPTKPKLPTSLHNHKIDHENMTTAKSNGFSYFPKNVGCLDGFECTQKFKNHFHCNHFEVTDGTRKSCKMGIGNLAFTSKKSVEEHHKFHTDSVELEPRHIKTFHRYSHDSDCKKYLTVAESCKLSNYKTHYHCVYNENGKICRKTFSQKQFALEHFGRVHRNHHEQIIKQVSNPIQAMLAKSLAKKEAIGAKVEANEATPINQKDETKQESST